MFPHTQLTDLCSDAVYQFAERKPLYLELLKYFSDLFDYKQALEQWKQFDQLDKNENLWWVMNEGWKTYGTVNTDVPIAWLAMAKRAVQWNHIPSNFHPWALAILEHFDLERYQAAYHMPAEEYEAVARDLPVVLQGLRDYPKDRFAPPIDETNWGLTDQ
jgi:hypothetical protein